MEKDDKRPQEIEELIAFVENTRAGKLSDKDISYREVLQCFISRDDVDFLENDNVQEVGTVLYGIH